MARQTGQTVLSATAELQWLRMPGSLSLLAASCAIAVPGVLPGMHMPGKAMCPAEHVMQCSSANTTARLSAACRSCCSSDPLKPLMCCRDAPAQVGQGVLPPHRIHDGALTPCAAFRQTGPHCVLAAPSPARISLAVSTVRSQHAAVARVSRPSCSSQTTARRT